MLEQPIIAQIAERIRTATPPGTRILAFGSMARGTARPDSDLDLLVIEPEQTDHYREAGRLYRLMRGLKTPVDILVTDLATFDAWKDTPCTVYNEANRDGVVLA
jgi:predicted nucleotidyltransferase